MYQKNRLALAAGGFFPARDVGRRCAMQLPSPSRHATLLEFSIRRSNLIQQVHSASGGVRPQARGAVGCCFLYCRWKYYLALLCNVARPLTWVVSQSWLRYRTRSCMCMQGKLKWKQQIPSQNERKKKNTCTCMMLCYAEVDDKSCVRIFVGGIVCDGHACIDDCVVVIYIFCHHKHNKTAKLVKQWKIKCSLG